MTTMHVFISLRRPFFRDMRKRGACVNSACAAACAVVLVVLLIVLTRAATDQQHQRQLLANVANRDDGLVSSSGGKVALSVLDGPLDAIIIPGGGSQRGASPRTLPVSVRRRLDLALVRWYQHATTFPNAPRPFLIVLSAGTVHRPNYIDAGGWPVSEAASEAQYLLEVSEDDHKDPIPPELILQEAVSLDTIGNAYFTRVIHTDPVRMRRLHVITSEYHLQRTRAIFELVFAAVTSPATMTTVEALGGVMRSGGGATGVRVEDAAYRLSFESSTEADVVSADLAIRKQREAASLKQFRRLLEGTFGLTLRHTPPTLHDGSSSDDVAEWGVTGAAIAARVSLGDIHQWLFTKHDAYASRRGALNRPPVDPKLLNTY